MSIGMREVSDFIGRLRPQRGLACPPAWRTASPQPHPGRGVPAPGALAVDPAPSVNLDRILAAARTAPDLKPIEWDGDAALVARTSVGQSGAFMRPLGADTGSFVRYAGAETSPARSAASDTGAFALQSGSRTGAYPRYAGAETGAYPVFAGPLVESDPRTYDPRCRKIRDRYISARFPTVARSAADLDQGERMIKAARLYFEEDRAEAALELLELSIEQNPCAEAVWLAELEIAFLVRDAQRFVECARAFRVAHPGCSAWPEVTRLGRALAPAEPLFGPKSGPREHEHYGPWPHLPNWIQASWDLTAEVVAADFHRAMARRGSEMRPLDNPTQLAA